MNTSVVSQHLDPACTSFQVEQVSSGKLKLLQDSPSSLKAKVYMQFINGSCVVVKDYAHAHPLIKVLICQWLIKREIAALRRLHAHPGVPVFKGRLGRCAFAMELIEGHTLNKSALKNTPLLVKQLTAHILDIHKYGVTHNDIRARNILIDQKQNLHIIDFAGAIIKPESAYRLTNLLYKLTKFIERVKVVRIKQQFLPNALNEQERRLVKFVLPLMNISRWWKKHVYSRLKFE